MDRANSHLTLAFTGWCLLFTPGIAGAQDLQTEGDRTHWAFQRVVDATPPRVANREWCVQPIDFFIRHRLEAAGISPVSDAPPEVWLRRVSFDLTGLPPGTKLVQDFLSDRSPFAKERIVDRLIASPQFGVHWGRHWLDVVRYADSNGNDFNATYYNAWRYRDYVVSAYNRDKPLQDFITEQIAGDLLPALDRQTGSDHLVATGLLMIGPKMLSERDKEKLRMDVVDEQVDTVGRAFLGLTFGCARCHDHKFDPISTADYYGLAGIFRNTRTLEGEIQQYVSDWPRTSLPVPSETEQAFRQYQAQIQQLKKAITTTESEITRLERVALLSGPNIVLVDDENAVKVGTWKASTHSPNFVGNGYIHDDNAGKGEKSVTFIAKVPASGAYEVRVSSNGSSGRAAAVPVSIEHSQGTERTTVNQRNGPDIGGLFHSLGTFTFDSAEAARVTISTSGTKGHVIVDALQLIRADESSSPSAEDPNLRAVTDSQDRLKKLKDELKTLQKSAPAPLPQAMAAGDYAQIEECKIRIRGEPDQLGEQVARGIPAIFRSQSDIEFPDGESGRLELAEWITSRDNPLTYRVAVNRVWVQLFGEGLVRSVDNLGIQGTPPTHPQLLDYLATRLMASGSNIKSLVRMIVLSRTYGLDSVNSVAGKAGDPENRLLWRANRKVLSSEALRDTLLSVSGRLDLSPGSSPVSNLGKLAIQNGADQAKGNQISNSRRTLYLPVVRNDLPELLTLFDFADPDMVVGKRNRTNVPAQALFLLNNSFVRDAANRTAERLIKQFPGEKTRLEQVCLLLLNRSPTEAERQRDLAFIRLIGRGKQAELEAWTRYVHCLFASTSFRMLD